MNRRDFLKSSTLAAAAALASPKLLRAGNNPNQVTPNYGLASITGIIDWHTHWISDTEIAMLKTRAAESEAVCRYQLARDVHLYDA